MKKLVQLIVWGVSLSFSLNSFSYIYEVKVLRKWNASRKKYHYYIGLSDFHDKTDPSNQQQLKKIQDLLDKSNKDTIKVSIEDLSSVNNSGRVSCGKYMVNSKGGVLGGLAQTCRNTGLQVNNVEFRYCRVVALGPVLNNLTQPLSSFPSVTDTTMGLIIDEINHEIAEIKSQTPHKSIAKQYDSTIKAVEQQLAALHMHESRNLSVADYLEKYSTPQNRLEYIKNLLTFDSALLDLRLALETTNNFSNMDKDVQIAGGAHIGRTTELLQKVGYKDVNITKINYGKEHDIAKCLGSNIIDGAFCIKPQPISLDFIDDVFLKSE